MYKELLANGLKAGLHWGAEQNKVNPDTYGYILGYRRLRTSNNVDSRKAYSVIDLDLSFQALRRAVLYIKKVSTISSTSEHKILCVIDNSLPTTLSLQLGYMALKNKFIVKTGKEAQALLKERSRLRCKKGRSRLLSTLKNTASSIPNTPEIAALFMVGGFNSGRSMTIIAARKAGVPVISLCDTTACLDGITYPIIMNTTSSSALHYVLEVITLALSDKTTGERS